MQQQENIQKVQKSHEASEVKKNVQLIKHEVSKVKNACS